MSGALTRILNNQIYSKTIIASQKIADGSITGTLFASNVTVPGDFLITGNLVVLGNSTQTTIASTNTYVNDPLITLNNGLSSTNTYDEGLLFNRGSGLNTAFIWNEFNQEFRFVNTTETGTTYGNINQTSLGNVRLGNLVVQYDQTVRNVTASGNLAVNYGNITTTASTFNLVNQSATTVVEYATATSVTTGATTGATFTLNPGTLVGFNTTQNVFNTTATTVNAFGAATSLNLGAATGTATVNNQTLSLPNGTALTTGQGTFSLLNSTATTINFAGAATTLSVGASSGTTTFNSTTNSTSSGSGAVVVAGGAGIGGNLYVGQNAVINGNLTVNGNVTYINSQNLATEDALVNINTGPNGAPLSGITTTDIGIMSHYYVSGDTSLFFGRKNSSGYFTVLSAATASNVGQVTGNYGTIQAGNLILFGNTANVTSTTYQSGALQVYGGFGLNGNLNVISGSQIVVGADIGNVANFPSSAAQFFTNTNNFAQVNSQNINAGNNASSDFIATADNGSNNDTYIDLGMNSSTYNQSAYGVTKANDGYLYVYGNAVTGGGNLVLGTATTNNDIVFHTGGTQASNEVARISQANANLTIKLATASTSSATGALTVVGGLGIGGNVWISGGAGAVQNFTIGSVANASSVYFDPRYQTLVVNGPAGGSNVTTPIGASFVVRSTDAIILPVGTTAQRPSNQGNVDQTGMLRMNSTTNQMEYYVNNTWQVAGSAFTVISDRQFAGTTLYGNVDGVNATFTIQSNATTASTLVSINGVVQFPVLAYSVSGTTLTFTEAPAINDVIDVRIFTTTTTITTLSSGNGLNQFIADNTGASMWSGTSSTIEQVLLDTNGNFNFLNGNHVTYNQTAVNIPATATPYVIDTFSQSSYTTGKYTIQAKVGSTNFETYEAHVITDGAGNAYISTFGIVNNGTNFGSISANVVSGNVRVYYTSTIAQANVKAFGTYIV